jgi:nucleotide-binding universal stress UspA family protein
VFVHVRPPEPIPTPHAARRRRRALEEVAAGVRRTTGERAVQVLEGDPVESLLAYADERGARLVVAGPATGGADAWLAAGLANDVSFPVVVVVGTESPRSLTASDVGA